MLDLCSVMVTIQKMLFRLREGLIAQRCSFPMHSAPKQSQGETPLFVIRQG